MGRMSGDLKDRVARWAAENREVLDGDAKTRCLDRCYGNSADRV